MSQQCGKVQQLRISSTTKDLPGEKSNNQGSVPSSRHKSRV